MTKMQRRRMRIVRNVKMRLTHLLSSVELMVHVFTLSWFPFLAELGSDEDDIDDEGQEYLEMLAKQAGEDGDDEEWEEDDAEETALEGYTTAVDDDENPVDEYQIFKAILQSKSSLRSTAFYSFNCYVTLSNSCVFCRYPKPRSHMVPGAYSDFG